MIYIISISIEVFTRAFIFIYGYSHRQLLKNSASINILFY